MKKLLVATTALVTFAAAGVAGAADMHVKAPLKAPPPPILSWTGCYIGGNVGGKWARATDTWAASPAGFAGPAFISATGSNTMDGSGIIGGGTLGCNYQTSNVVFGLEGDFDWTSVTGSTDLTTANLGATQIYHSDFAESWLATVRGRLGVTFNSWLVYATGGLAIANISYTDAVFFAASRSTDFGAASSARTGWTVGGGLETMFSGGWSFKAEYLFVDILGPDFTQVNALFPLATIGTTHELKENIVRAGLNYRLNWGGPVTTRY
jgi:outer membrane immunogenic protein